MQRLRWVAVLVVVVVMAGCSLEYESGKTRCSASMQCPAGFRCVSDLCWNESAPITGTGGNGGDRGTGGAGGTGGARGTGGAGGGPVDTRPDATDTTPQSCPSTHPQMCAARNGVAGTCATTTADCDTLTRCGTRTVVCTRGYRPDCQYVNPCGPTNNVCPNPEFPQLCPARGTIGPDCYGPGMVWDCSTAVNCASNGADVRICRTGFRVDCTKPRGMECALLDARGCTNPMYPTFCPGINGATNDCWRAGTDCSTVRSCNGENAGCPTGYQVDCATDTCRPTGAPDGGALDVRR